MAIRIRPELVDRYKELHADPWPEMNIALKAANLHNYTIFLNAAEGLLFGVWDYRGCDYEADMRWLGEQDVTKRWLALTDLCQIPFQTAAEGEWWSFMDTIFHLE